MGRLAFVLAVAVLVPAAPSGAAWVGLGSGGRIDAEPVTRLEFTAAHGEANDVSVTVTRIGADRQGSPTLVTVHDAGSELGALDGCSATDAHTVRCRSRDELGEVEVTVGDDRAVVRSVTRDQFVFQTVLEGGPGNDVLTAGDGGDVAGGPGDDTLIGSRAYESMDGGPGNDTLWGGGHGDHLAGGPGDDAVHGGAGNDDVIGGGGAGETAAAGADRLYGDGGDDSLDDGDARSEPAAIGPDLLDGGPGSDRVDSYRTRIAPVTVDLSGPAPAGQAGENDSIRDVEDVVGGHAGDALTGSEAANVIDGRGGDDRVHGGAGGDVLFADERDTVSGDAGDDRIRTVPQYDGSLSCGAGADVVRLDVFLAAPPGLAGPYIERGCELLIDGNGFRIVPQPRLDSGQRLWFRVPRLRCCRLTLTVSQPATFAWLGSRPIRSAAVGVRIPAPIARRIRAAGAVLRASVQPLGAAPFVWRFYAHRP